MRLKKLEVNSFGGISPASPVIIDFTQSNFVVAKADFGKNKTSLLNALLVACGQLSKDNKNFINNDSGKIDIDLDFVGKDRLTYHVRCTKSSFSLTYDGNSIAEPITKMKELLGVVGVSPMEIKNRPLKEIVRWLSAYLSKDADQYEMELDKLKKAIKGSQDTRAAANRSLKALVEYLDNDTMYTNWEKSEEKFKECVSIKMLSARLDEAGKKSDRLLQAETKLKQLQERKTSIDDQIEKLMAEAAEIDKSIKAGEKFIEENKAAKKEYDGVKLEYDNAASQVVNFNKWQDIKKKKKEKDDFEDISQRADAKEKELLQKVKELQSEILPDIKNVELITEDTYEDGKLKKEGFYWNGKNVAQLSQTEWWLLVMEIWRKYKVKVVVIDNFGELGSMAAEMLTKLSKDGAFILAAEMNRKQKELIINYE
jgi:hypothetical protein